MDKKNPHTLVVAFVFVTITVGSIYWINTLPHNPFSRGMKKVSVDYEIARVINVQSESLKGSLHYKDIMTGSQKLLVKILTGSHRGEKLTARNHLSTYNSVVGKPGRYLIVIVDELDSGKFQVRVYNYFRAPVIYFILFLFFTLLVIVGRKKGLMSGLGLIYTFVCVFTVFMPLVLRGYSPVWAAVLLLVLVSTGALMLINGVTMKSLCCILGTISGVLMSSLILMVFGHIMHISGYSTDEAESLLLIGQTTGLKVKDLLYSGILIVSLGAIMDIAMSVVSSMSEVKLHRPDSSALVLFKAGMNVGKDVIGTMSNTLILVFTGTSLNMLIILSSYSVQYNQFMNMNRTAIEITQALSGSLALVLTVPLTALISSRLLKK